jgi:hypothetical protein
MFLKEYSQKYKDDLIQSLIIGKILIKNNNILVLSNKNNISTNLINVFFNNSSFLEDEETDRLENLALSRNDIISCVVNHIIKKESQSLDELLFNVNTEIKLFTVSESMLNLVLEKMIKMDYISFDNNKYNKLFY